MSTFQPYAAMPFYPGPVSVHPAVAAALAKDYAPPRMGTEYLELGDISFWDETGKGSFDELVFDTPIPAMQATAGSLRFCCPLQC